MQIQIYSLNTQCQLVLVSCSLALAMNRPQHSIVTNVKVSFKLNKSFQIQDALQQLKNTTHPRIKLYPNFAVVRDTFVFIIFHSRSDLVHVNVTKIPELTSIRDSVYLFKKIFKCTTSDIGQFHVDNITGAGQHEKEALDIELISEKCSASTGFHCHYNPQRFPGFFLKTQWGTALLFKNSKKFTTVGSRNQEDLFRLHHVIQQLVL